MASDHQKLKFALVAAGAVAVGRSMRIKAEPGQTPLNPVRFQAYRIGAKCLIVGACRGKVGVYTLRGKDGDPIADDIHFVIGLGIEAGHVRPGVARG